MSDIEWMPLQKDGFLLRLWWRKTLQPGRSNIKPFHLYRNDKYPWLCLVRAQYNVECTLRYRRYCPMATKRRLCVKSPVKMPQTRKLRSVDFQQFRDSFRDVVNDLEFKLDGHRLIGEITSQQIRDGAKKLLQLKKNCAYYMLKDLIFDNSVQFKAGQPLVLQESECQQLVMICSGNNSSGLVEVQLAAIKLYVPC
ncbi:hypothetical protein MP228_006276 [Amoeboaphelidium protococcarum]|nr:hypothetical protein MP228_006276 [Amoeboaphelidium protococcarum]